MKIQREGEVGINFKVLGDGAAFRMQRVNWEVDLRRLVASSLHDDCGDLVAKVLEQLPHTPVRAVGHNFHYTGSDQDWGDSPIPALRWNAKKTPEEPMEFEQVRWTGTFRRNGTKVEVVVVADEEQFAVLFNNHRETDPRNAQSAILAAREFQRDREASEGLLRTLLSQEVKR